MKRQTLSITIVSFITLLLVVLVVVLSVLSAKTVFAKQANYTIKHVATEKASYSENLFNYAKNSIQLVSSFTSSNMTERELKNPNEVFNKYANQTPFTLLEYIRWDGLNYMNSTADEEPFDASDRVYYKNGIRGISSIWPNFNPKSAKEVLLNFYTPLYYKNEIAGVITGAMGEVTTLRPHMKATFYDKEVGCILFNEDYRVISSTCEEIVPGTHFMQYRDDAFISNIIRHTRDKDYEPFNYYFDGRKGLCCIAPVESLGWNIGIIVFPSIYSEKEQDILERLIYVVGFVAALLVLYLIVFIYIQTKNHKLVQAGLLFTANRDELTGLLNRHAYMDHLDKLTKNPLANDLIYISMDVNGLKKTNDNFGHAAGDSLLKGAADCIYKTFSEYGSIYRTGGDEFQAIINASEEELDEMKEKLKSITSEWKDKYNETISISCGYVLKAENENYTITEMSKIADQRMYRDKSLYYISKGMDRRSSNEAYEVICNSYTKILNINLTEDNYKIIKMNTDECVTEKGFNEKISKWLHDFGVSGQVHEEDINSYLEKTDLEYMKKYFAEGNKELLIKYRRLIGNKFCNVIMEMLPTKEYSNTNQNLYLYVKNIGD